MKNLKFEEKLANHCAASLLGAKVSNLVVLNNSSFENLSELIYYYNSFLLKHNLRLVRLCHCSKRSTVILINEKLLSKTLSDTKVKGFLKNYGYDINNNIYYYINKLSKRMNDKAFPHEIGVFLGYPLDDVISFIENKGSNYKLCGYWKVYSDVEKASMKFRYISLLRDSLNSLLETKKDLLYIIDRLYNKDLKLVS